MTRLYNHVFFLLVEMKPKYSFHKKIMLEDTVVNRTLTPLNGRSLAITHTVVLSNKQTKEELKKI